MKALLQTLEPSSKESASVAGVRTDRPVGLELLEWFGGVGVFCVRLLKAVLRPPYEFKELLRQMDEVGAKSLPLVALAGAAIGVVLSLHLRDSMAQFGAKSMLPELIILSLIKESGPIITA